MLVVTKPDLKKALIVFICLELCALFSICFIDKPLALFIHADGWDKLLFLRLISECLLYPLTILILILLLFAFRQQKKWQVFIHTLYFYLSLQLTMAIKSRLKITFGRYWPKTWIQNNLSLIHDGIYGFNWWHGFANQGSFPSGHSCYTAFCCVWLYTLLPRLLTLWLLISILVPFSLVTLNYHFLGDCLSGVGLGGFCGIWSIWFYQKFTLRFLNP